MAGTGFVLTGTTAAYNTVANIEFYDGARDLGGTGQLSSNAWSFTPALGPGTHQITARLTSFFGNATVTSPYDLVTGIAGQPYTAQEIDLDGAGRVVGTTDYGANGGTVSQAQLSSNSAAAAATPRISFDSTATFLGPTAATLTGTVSGVSSTADLEIYDGPASAVIDPSTGAALPGATDLGAATLNGDGTWTFDAHVSPGAHQFTAIVTKPSGASAAAQSSYEIVTGVVGKPYVYEELDLNSAGRTIAATAYGADGSVVNQSARGGVDSLQGGAAPAQVVYSSFDDVMTGGGQSTSFVFSPGFGQDEITNFHVDNSVQPHDYLNLPNATFTSLAALFHHTSTALDGDAVIHLSPTDSIKIDGVTKAELIAHPIDFRFHG